jgi:hypothetical protein
MDRVTDRETNTLAVRGLEELRVNLLLKENSYASNIILHQSFILELKFHGPEGRSCCVGRVEPLRSLLAVRYGKVEVMKNILVPTLFLLVRKSSRCSHRRLRYGST